MSLLLHSQRQISQNHSVAREGTPNKLMVAKKARKQTTVLVEQVSTVELTKKNTKNTLVIQVRSGTELLGNLTLGRGSVEWRPQGNKTTTLKKSWKAFVALLEREMNK